MELLYNVAHWPLKCCLSVVLIDHSFQLVTWHVQHKKHQVHISLSMKYIALKLFLWNYGGSLKCISKHEGKNFRCPSPRNLYLESPSLKKINDWPLNLGCYQKVSHRFESKPPVPEVGRGVPFLKSDLVLGVKVLLHRYFFVILSIQV